MNADWYLGRSGFGEVHKALDKNSQLYVAIKKTLLEGDAMDLEEESKVLMKCNSPFIVRYHGLAREGNQLWVGYNDCWISS